MNKFYFLAALACVFSVFIAGCAPSDEEDNSDERTAESVYQFGVDFSRQASENLLDSLKVHYPGIQAADSVKRTFSADSVSISQVSGDSLFRINLGTDISLLATVDTLGNIEVKSSKGLFAFPEKKMGIARLTGMANDTITDIELAERMKDDAFFKMIDKSVKTKIANIVTVGKFKATTNPDFYGGGEQTLKNTTDQEIKGGEYTIVIKESYDGGIMDGYSETKNKVGKTIPAHGSVKIELEGSKHGGEEITRIVMNLPQSELMERFVTFTGKEYDDYIAKKK